MWEFLADNLRLIGALICGIALGAMTGNIWMRRRHITRRARRIFFWFYLIVINIASISLWNYNHDIPANPGVYVNILLMCGLIASLMWHPEGDAKTPPDDGAFGTKVINYLLDRWDRRHPLNEQDNQD